LGCSVPDRSFLLLVDVTNTALTADPEIVDGKFRGMKGSSEVSGTPDIFFIPE
jgi:hypothetical protein